MAEVTLTEEQHGQFVHDLEEAEESFTNAQTVLANRIIDVSDLKQDIDETIRVLQNISRQLEDF